MNTRTRNPPAKIASGTTSHQDTGRHRYIRYHSSPSGMSVLMICHEARHTEGFWYLSTISFHAALSTWGFAGIALASFVIALNSLTPISTTATGTLNEAQAHGSFQTGSGWRFFFNPCWMNGV